MIKICTALHICMLLLAACSPSPPPPRPAPPPASAAEKFLLIGLIPEHNIFRQMERYDPLARYLSRGGGEKIKLKVLSRYGNIIDNFVSGRMDGAFFGSFTYALARARLRLNVLARPLALNGESTYHGLILVRKDSGIRKAAQMKGKVFAFVDRATTAGYLLPLAYFHRHGIADYHTYFRETYYAGTHEDVIYDVLNGKADVGAAKNTVLLRLGQKDARIGRELLILERSPDVPENALAVRPDLERAVKEHLQRGLLTMHEDPEGRKVLNKFGVQKFIPTGDADYEPVYRYARAIRLNLASYNYQND